MENNDPLSIKKFIVDENILITIVFNKENSLNGLNDNLAAIFDGNLSLKKLGVFTKDNMFILLVHVFPESTINRYYSGNTMIVPEFLKNSIIKPFEDKPGSKIELTDLASSLVLCAFVENGIITV